MTVCNCRLPVLKSVKGLDGRVCSICGTWYEDNEWEDAMAKKARALATPKMPKVGRNDPCPCNSGLKFKKCCMNMGVV